MNIPKACFPMAETCARLTREIGERRIRRGGYSPGRTACGAVQARLNNGHFAVCRGKSIANGRRLRQDRRALGPSGFRSLERNCAAPAGPRVRVECRNCARRRLRTEWTHRLPAAAARLRGHRPRCVRRDVAACATAQSGRGLPPGGHLHLATPPFVRLHLGVGQHLARAAGPTARGYPQAVRRAFRSRSTDLLDRRRRSARRGYCDLLRRTALPCCSRHSGDPRDNRSSELPVPSFRIRSRPKRQACVLHRTALLKRETWEQSTNTAQQRPNRMPRTHRSRDSSHLAPPR
jgi:hypothetical protein